MLLNYRSVLIDLHRTPLGGAEFLQLGQRRIWSNFPPEHRSWYGGELFPTHPHRRLRITLPGGWCGAALDPSRPTTLAVVEHEGRAQHATEEADAAAALVRALLSGGIAAEDVAVLSPHRAQNSLIRARLSDAGIDPLPLVDTVERLQGAERDVVLLSLIASDPDQLDSAFLLDPRRFNVAITRARLKLMVIASRALIEALPRREDALIAGEHLARFAAHCRERGAVVSVPGEKRTPG